MIYSGNKSHAIIVIRVPGYAKLSRAQQAAMKRKAQAELGYDVKLLLLDKGCTVDVLDLS